MGALDQFGRPVNQGDRVYVTGVVETLGDPKSISDAQHYVNVVVLCDQLMPPSNAQSRLNLNTAQIVGLAPGPLPGMALPGPQPQLSPNYFAAPAVGVPPGKKFNVITHGVSSAWTASTFDSWLTVTSPTTPTTGDGTVTYNIANNATGPSRAGVITVIGLGADLTFVVEQAAGPAGPQEEDKHKKGESH